MQRLRTGLIHLVLIAFAALTLVPFAFTFNNVFRTNSEFYRAFFSFPEALKDTVRVAAGALGDGGETVEIEDADGEARSVGRGEAIAHHLGRAWKGPTKAWTVIRPYMVNTLFVACLTAFGVVLLGSSTAYILARYRFLGSKAIFVLIISTMMFPGVLTLVPSFLLVKKMGLLNTYWAMILPYIAGGQVFAIFIFKSFFEGISEDLFEAARIDGAGHARIYWNIVLPLSHPAISVVLIMNILGTWNNFLWPFIVNTDGTHHVVASGLFTLANTTHIMNSDYSTMYAGYALSSIPLLILFLYATKPFIRGMTSGAFKA